MLRQGLSLLLVCILGSVVGKGGPKGDMSDQWLMKTSDISNTVRRTMEGYGLEIVSQPFPGFVLLRRSSVMSGRKVDTHGDKQNREPEMLAVSAVKQLRYKNLTHRGVLPKQSKGFTITDNYWSWMWYIKTDQFPSMHVYDVWQLGYTGSGVHVTILDDGLEPTHTDLDDNYVDVLSFDYVNGISYVAHAYGDDHGTKCAGIVSAEKNNDCVAGVAFESTFSSVKVFDAYNSLTEVESAVSLIHTLNSTDVYSNSYGPDDSGSIFEGPSEIEIVALKLGVTLGRDGKGAIYTWANGNGGSTDDCNCDGYANSIYTIAVTSVDSNQGTAYYAESCSSVFVSTYGGSSPDEIVTTSKYNSCTRFFYGTSAACPMASGIIALLLQARPDLTWRDVQHLIVETASREGLIRAYWQTNGAGIKVSHTFGFGLLDASAMITRSVSWKLVKEQVTCESNIIKVNSSSYNGVYVTNTFDSDGCGSGGVRHLEHVQVWINFWSTARGLTQIRLFSPQGTESVLLHERTNDYYSGATEWTFMTVQSWGENPIGKWTLQLEGLSSSLSFGLDSWSLILYGTSEDAVDTTNMTTTVATSQTTTDAISGPSHTSDPKQVTSKTTKGLKYDTSQPITNTSVTSQSSTDAIKNDNAESTDDDSVTYGVVGGVLGGVAAISGATGVGIYLLKKAKKILPTET